VNANQDHSFSSSKTNSAPACWDIELHKISPHLFSGTFEWAITSPLSRMSLRVKRGLKKINVKRRELSLIISDYVSGLCARKLPRRSQIQFKAEDKSAPSSRGVHAPPQLKNSTLITLSARRRIEFTQSCVAKFLPVLPSLCVGKVDKVLASAEMKLSRRTLE
jgi:hypothetical protein